MEEIFPDEIIYDEEINTPYVNIINNNEKVFKKAKEEV